MLDKDKKQLLISLRATKNHGDDLYLTTTRKLTDKFADQSNWVAAETKAATPELRMRVLFPTDRQPRDAEVRSDRTEKRQPLTPELEGGRPVLSYRCNPRRTDTYYINWAW